MPKKAFLIIDVQKDFCSKGALAVPNGDKIIPRINTYIKRFQKKKCFIFASRDWHPENSLHFQENGGIWPQHCIQNTEGAKFHPKLQLPPSAVVVSKGILPDDDGYSVFQGIDKDGVSLEDLLISKDIKEIFIAGLATDYCVKATALEGRKRKFKVFLLTDAVKGVNLMRDDSKHAIDEMIKAGVVKKSLKTLKL